MLVFTQERLETPIARAKISGKSTRQIAICDIEATEKAQPLMKIGALAHNFLPIQRIF